MRTKIDPTSKVLKKMLSHDLRANASLQLLPLTSSIIDKERKKITAQPAVRIKVKYYVGKAFTAR